MREQPNCPPAPDLRSLPPQADPALVGRAQRARSRAIARPERMQPRAGIAPKPFARLRSSDSGRATGSPFAHPGRPSHDEAVRSILTMTAKRELRRATPPFSRTRGAERLAGRPNQPTTAQALRPTQRRRYRRPERHRRVAGQPPSPLHDMRLPMCAFADLQSRVPLQAIARLPLQNPSKYARANGHRPIGLWSCVIPRVYRATDNRQTRPAPYL